MATSIVVDTHVSDSTEAGTALGLKVSRAFEGESPDVLLVFSSVGCDHQALLGAALAACKPKVLLGGSSSGGFTRTAYGEGIACAIAIRDPDMQFRGSMARGLGADPAVAAAGLVTGFAGPDDSQFRYHSALVLADTRGGQMETLVEELTRLTRGRCQFLGGGAAGDQEMKGVKVFLGTEVVDDAVVALEILSNKPLGIGVGHGWQPASEPMRVTEAQGMRLVSLNASPAADVYRQHAEGIGQRFNSEQPLPFFLANVLGMKAAGGHKLRVPLGLLADDSLVCAAEVPEGTIVQIMTTSPAAVIEAARRATRSALEQLGSHRPSLALFFDCVGTRLGLGETFRSEIAAVIKTLGPTQMAGYSSMGQIFRAEGQFSGFHNCTAIVLILPE
jgi:hypothetical protein